MALIPMSTTTAAHAHAALPGVSQEAAKAKAAEKRREVERPKGIKRDADEVIVGVSNVELDDPVRSLKGNVDEETREDRQEHAATAYSPNGPNPRGTRRPGGQPPRSIDLKG
jgi:hypothetical protein